MVTDCDINLESNGICHSNFDI